MDPSRPCVLSGEMGYLGHFQWVVTVVGALQKVFIPYRSLMKPCIP